MKNKYQVEVVEFTEVHDLPEAWSRKDFLNLLNLIEFEDGASILAEELKEMTIAAISDLEIEEAVTAVLNLRFGDKLNHGQKNNLINELKDDRIWEEYSEIKHHEELFNVCCMMHWAFPREFSLPDIVRIQLKITSLNTASLSNLRQPKASFLARLLGDGMDEHNIIYRLFDENIVGNSFPNATDIIWKFEESGFNGSNNSNDITIYSSWNWVDELKEVDRFESAAHSDGQLG
ncbi:MAG: hypothetical protein OSB25_04830 [Salibacteraceae bacterium]|nr:hypothetical protein [Salibacteraceae bacterium]|tara:strand:- start:67199 stop:67897 length:699 start_codon:yes stop_codon:yes gene_type:complete